MNPAFGISIRIWNMRRLRLEILRKFSLLPFLPFSDQLFLSRVMVDANSVNESSTLDPAYAAPLLSFQTDSRSTSTCRTGKLTLHARDGSTTPNLLQTIATPGLISTAPRGAINHLTPDNLKRCRTQGVHLALEHL